MEIIWRVISGQGEGREWRGKVQGIRSIIGRYKTDRGKLRIVWEMEKPKNLYVQPTDMNEGVGGMLVRGAVHSRGGLRLEKKRDNCNSIINKIYLKINKIK